MSDESFVSKARVSGMNRKYTSKQNQDCAETRIRPKDDAEGVQIRSGVGSTKGPSVSGIRRSD